MIDRQVVTGVPLTSPRCIIIQQMHPMMKCHCILTPVITEVPLDAVKNEPALLPRFDFAAHLHQVALAHLLREDDEGAGVYAVAGRLHVGSQVKLLLAVGQVARHWTGL